jgi:RNA polymerase sigma-70 factor (ECF subfamily)
MLTARRDHTFARTLAVADKRRQRIESYLDRLAGYAVCLTNDRDQARELVQDCALRALSAQRVPQDEPAYRAWVFTILRNLHVDRLRRRRQPPESLGEAESAPSWQVWQFDEALITGITVRVGMARLRPAQREILGLVDIAGFSYAETARILEIAPGTVMSRLSRARQALLVALADSNVHPFPARRRKTGPHRSSR